MAGVAGFRAFLETLGPLSEEDWDRVAPVGRLRTFEKGQVLLRPGDKANTVYFVSEGLFRIYTISRGREQTRNFFSEGALFTEAVSYFSRRPTTFFLEALETATVIEMEREELHAAFEATLSLARIGRRMIEASVAALAIRVADALGPQGPVRYRALRASRPDLFQRVPQYMIASYLAMTPETLSRITARSR